MDTEQPKKARTAKTRTVGIRVTEREYTAFQREAYERNQTVSEWGRIKVLSASPAFDHNGLSKHIFTELVGLQLLLMNIVTGRAKRSRRGTLTGSFIVCNDLLKNEGRLPQASIVAKHLADELSTLAKANTNFFSSIFHCASDS